MPLTNEDDVLMLLQEINLDLHRWTVHKAEGQRVGPLAGTSVPGTVALKLEAKVCKLQLDLQGVVTNLAGCAKSAIDTAAQLQEQHGGGADGWHNGGYSAADIAQAALALGRMLKREVAVAEAVCADAGDCSSRDTLTLYAAAWMMQPTISKRTGCGQYFDAISGGGCPYVEGMLLKGLGGDSDNVRLLPRRARFVACPLSP
ncbi:hypothetical protein JKP88DRAFT_252180 [Tribonema minus]|uniref:Uncharacterized protein n=1 Tax=Tribonema minus TaxID=303371 RepID=A0A835ZCP9_9STRA|nr:hypothetical protein JKP88DRAFT_252180 [Tribonema minus]